MYTRIRISGFFSRVTYVFVLEKTKGILNSLIQQNLMPINHPSLTLVGLTTPPLLATLVKVIGQDLG
jgi:hypothetical protein